MNEWPIFYHLSFPVAFVLPTLSIIGPQRSPRHHNMIIGLIEKTPLQLTFINDDTLHISVGKTPHILLFLSVVICVLHTAAEHYPSHFANNYG